MHGHSIARSLHRHICDTVDIDMTNVIKELGIIEGLGQANSCDEDILSQMREKFIASGSDEPALPPRPPGEVVELDEEVFTATVKDLDPLKGVSVRGVKADHIRALHRGNFEDEAEASGALRQLRKLGELYFNARLPTWLHRKLNAGLCTPLVKKAAPEGCTPDARPVCSEDSDMKVWRRRNTQVGRLGRECGGSMPEILAPSNEE